MRRLFEMTLLVEIETDEAEYSVNENGVYNALSSWIDSLPEIASSKITNLKQKENSK